MNNAQTSQKILPSTQNLNAVKLPSNNNFEKLLNSSTKQSSQLTNSFFNLDQDSEKNDKNLNFVLLGKY